jgi:hypothetical protein
MEGRKEMSKKTNQRDEKVSHRGRPKLEPKLKVIDRCVTVWVVGKKYKQARLIIENGQAPWKNFSEYVRWSIDQLIQDYSSEKPRRKP